MSDVTNCTTCKKAIFDELWGEYKCLVRKHRIFDPEMHNNCTDYRKGEPSGSKEVRIEED